MFHCLKNMQLTWRKCCCIITLNHMCGAEKHTKQTVTAESQTDCPVSERRLNQKATAAAGWWKHGLELCCVCWQEVVCSPWRHLYLPVRPTQIDLLFHNLHRLKVDSSTCSIRHMLYTFWIRLLHWRELKMLLILPGENKQQQDLYKKVQDVNGSCQKPKKKN